VNTGVRGGARPSEKANAAHTSALFSWFTTASATAFFARCTDSTAASIVAGAYNRYLREKNDRAWGWGAGGGGGVRVRNRERCEIKGHS